MPEPIEQPAQHRQGLMLVAGAALGGYRLESGLHQWLTSAIKMTMGIGTPKSKSKSERIDKPPYPNSTGSNSRVKLY
jgi:hypothetical protein